MSSLPLPTRGVSKTSGDTLEGETYRWESCCLLLEEIAIRVDFPIPHDDRRDVLAVILNQPGVHTLPEIDRD